jgi:hypothetical protein
VSEAAVQETVGEDLPGQEADADRRAVLGESGGIFAQRPEHEVVQDFRTDHLLQQETDAEGPEQGGGDRGQAHAGRLVRNVALS